jgi:hypothetical protein
MIGPIDATLEQEFPARNSTRKVGYHNGVVVERSFGGVGRKPQISGRTCSGNRN